MGTFVSDAGKLLIEWHITFRNNLLQVIKSFMESHFSLQIICHPEIQLVAMLRHFLLTTFLHIFHYLSLRVVD